MFIGWKNRYVACTLQFFWKGSRHWTCRIAPTSPSQSPTHQALPGTFVRPINGNIGPNDTDIKNRLFTYFPNGKMIELWTIYFLKDLHQQAVSRQNNYSSSPDQKHTYPHHSADDKDPPRKVITSSTTTLPSVTSAISCSASSRQGFGRRRLVTFDLVISVLLCLY